MPFARSHIRRFADIKIRRPHALSQPYDPGLTGICQAYGWPSGIAVTPLGIVIGELGGAFYPNDVAPWAAKAVLPAPTVTTHLLPGADNSPGDADGEVALDWQKAAEVWSYLTGLPATITIVYGANSGPAFAEVMGFNAGPCGAGSWSWGSPEDNWAAGDRAALDAAAQSCPYPWCAASGDNDANDGEGNPVTDFPSCSPCIVGCGGTTLPRIGAEIVWNNGNGEGTGGGFSKLYGTPAWQPANSQGTGRMDPDCACNADPNTGYNVLIDGQWQVIGGTSAVAPIMAGFLAVVNGARLKAGKPALGSGILPAMWSLASSFFDIVNGNNVGFNATVGPDPCTGLGRPLGTLLSALVGGSVVNPPPPPPPPPPPVAAPLAVWNLPAIRTGQRVTLTFRAGQSSPAEQACLFPLHSGAQEAEVRVED